MTGLIKKILFFCSILIVLSGCQKVVDKSEDKNENQTPTDNFQKEDTTLIEEEKEVLIVWSFTDEIVTEIKGFEEINNCRIDFQLFDQDGYIPMLGGVLKNAQEAPDIIIMEPSDINNDKILPYLFDLTDFGLEESIKDKMNGCSLRLGTSIEGKLVAIPYQMNPVGLFYRRSMAIEAFGTDDPIVIQEMFSTYEGIEAAGASLKQKNIKLFPDQFALRHFANNAQTKWIDSNQLFVMDNNKRDFFETLNKLKVEGWIAYATEWSKEWFEGMYQTLEISEGSKPPIFAYVLPSWGLANVVMLTGNDDTIVSEDETGLIKVYNDTKGDWAVVDFSAPYYWGGSYLSIYKETSQKELALEFMKYMTLDTDHLSQWLSESYQISPVYEVQKKQNFAFGNDFLGGQNYSQVFAEIGNQTDSLVLEDTVMNEINREINRVFDTVVLDYIKGSYHTIDEALNDFKAQIKTMYPNLFVEEME